MLCWVFGVPSIVCQTERVILICCFTRSQSSHLNPRAHGRRVGEQGSLECKARGYSVELSEEIEGYLIGEERKKLRPSERHKL
jgi:hypothetical protein